MPWVPRAKGVNLAWENPGKEDFTEDLGFTGGAGIYLAHSPKYNTQTTGGTQENLGATKTLSMYLYRIKVEQGKIRVNI